MRIPKHHQVRRGNRTVPSVPLRVARGTVRPVKALMGKGPSWHIIRATVPSAVTRGTGISQSKKRNLGRTTSCGTFLRCNFQSGSDLAFFRQRTTVKSVTEPKLLRAMFDVPGRNLFPRCCKSATHAEKTPGKRRVCIDVTHETAGA